jgi:hypothetical protein
MQLSDLVTEVYGLTSRPDKATETVAAVRAATLKAHQRDFYPKDLVEVPLQFDSSAYQQTLQYRTLIPRWRAFKHLRKWDVDSSTPKDFLTYIGIEESMDEYKRNREDVVYLAGNNLQVRSGTQERYYLLGYYEHPDVTIAGYKSWVALEHPYAIIYEAARVIFKTIGFDEQASTYEKLVAEEYANLRLQITGNGY